MNKKMLIEKEVQIMVYTPTYNRETELERLYNSLCVQTNKHFCWLIIDDGSEDNTENIVSTWKKENKIAIKYIKKMNGGKHTAVNIGLDLADHYWNICIDSDDWLISSDAIEIIINDIKKIQAESDILSIIYPYQFKNHEIKHVSQKAVLVNDWGFRNKRKKIFETSIVSRPGAYEGIRFPIFSGENFIAESSIYTRKALKGKQIFINRPIVEGEYLETGLTNNIVETWRKNPQGYYHERILQVEYYIETKKFIKSLIPLGQIIAFNIDCGNAILFSIDRKYIKRATISILLGVIYWFKKFNRV